MNELSWDEVREKFLDCAVYGGMDSGRAHAVVEILGSLEKCGNMKELLQRL